MYKLAISETTKRAEKFIFVVWIEVVQCGFAHLMQHMMRWHISITRKLYFTDYWYFSGADMCLNCATFG